jgi:hypothetical protein
MPVAAASKGFKFAQPRPAFPILSDRNVAQELGPHRVHIQRVGGSYPSGHDPLRFDEDRAVGSFSGLAELTAGTGVTVNAVLPGGTASEGVTELLARFAKEQTKQSKHSRRSFSKNFVPQTC